MERLVAEGRHEVAALLRSLANSVEAEEHPFSDEPGAVAELSPDDARVVVVHMAPSRHRVLDRPLAVEQELSHPGG